MLEETITRKLLSLSLELFFKILLFHVSNDNSTLYVPSYFCVCFLFMKPSSFIMTSWNGNIFRVTGPLWGESTGHRWIPHTKASDAELWCFRWSTPQLTVEQTMETPGDLRRHWAHYDVIKMLCDNQQNFWVWWYHIEPSLFWEWSDLGRNQLCLMV